MDKSSTSASPVAEQIAPYVLLGMTAVTGLVDAVSFLSLGSVFTANMTGNILILAFATARVTGLSVARSSTALIAFFVGAILGGRITASASADSRMRFAAQAFLLEVIFLSAASFCSIGYRSDLVEHSLQPLVLIAFTGLAMGTRNAAVRKLAIPDLTTTVLTLTVRASRRTPHSRKAATRDWRGELVQSWRSLSAQRSVQSLYAIRSQPHSRLRPPSP
jgi:uncharacterized membrane protein YoaK (UPF0700 family)